jgi:hypothetical protein
MMKPASASHVLYESQVLPLHASEVAALEYLAASESMDVHTYARFILDNVRVNAFDCEPEVQLPRNSGSVFICGLNCLRW